jgi:hypothetical protein
MRCLQIHRRPEVRKPRIGGVVIDPAVHTTAAPRRLRGMGKVSPPVTNTTGDRDGRGLSAVCEAGGRCHRSAPEGVTDRDAGGVSVRVRVVVRPRCEQFHLAGGPAPMPSSPTWRT